jgi:hypothetical protein
LINGFLGVLSDLCGEIQDLSGAKIVARKP